MNNIDNIYAKYKIITGNYTIGNYKADCLINKKYETEIPESYFKKISSIANAINESTVKTNASELYSELFLNEQKLCITDNQTDFTYAMINPLILESVINEINEEDLNRLSEIMVLYEPEVLEEMMEDVITEDNNKIYSDRELICDFLMRLEGYVIRLKEMHWDADKKAQHEITEKTYDLLYELEDSIAEDMMGYMGSYITPGTIKPVLPNTDSLEGLLNLIKEDAVEFYKRIENNDNCIGIKSEIESFIHNMNKTIYLGKMI